MRNLNLVNSFENPWEDNSKKNAEPKKNLNKDPVSQELEEILRKGRERLADFLFANKRPNGDKNSFNSDSNQQKPGASGVRSSQVSWVIVVLSFMALIGWLLTGFYTVDTDEQGVVMRFGKYDRIATPGLNWKLPSPLETVERVSVTRINKEVIGFKAQQGTRGLLQDEADASIPKESQMLTGDENIIDMHFFVQWYIKNPTNYLFNIKDDFGESTIKVAAESAMRHIIGMTKISEALSEQRQEIEQQAKNILQGILDRYNSGIKIVNLGILYSYVAPEVRDAYRDIQSAKADKERAINQSQAYRNDIIPRARGEAKAILESAIAYKETVVAKAQGEAERFSSVFAQYSKAKDVTRKNMYINALEQVLKDKDKVVIDKNIGSGTLSLLSIADLLRQKEQ